MAVRVGALLGLLCAFGAARQSPYEPAQEGWDFSIGTYWMQMDEDFFAKYDLDETGEIEFDELREELVQDIMNPYMEYTKDKPMDNVVPKA
ncbi:hypothetical protein SO694_000890129 [Aureococcus anophagefferens]|uniref:EF-hand domain-containing protein n=1 Tax=Aureococcus anophagefferens TaxID=44056 RepID=A0ABR1FIZ8_AURAN